MAACQIDLSDYLYNKLTSMNEVIKNDTSMGYSSQHLSVDNYVDITINYNLKCLIWAVWLKVISQALPILDRIMIN